MPLNDFLTTIQSSLSRGQKNILNRFLEDAKSGRIQANAQDIQTSLEQVGSLIPDPGGDVTEPEGFNNTLSTILANIAGLYQEIDRVEATQDRLSDLNTAELARIEVALQDLETIIDSTRRAHAENTQWTDVFYETFGASIHREEADEWYRPLPVLAATGQVASFLPLVVDPEDHSLKLLTGGQFARSTDAQGRPLATVTVEEILGLSIDPNHRIDQAVDGKYYTYWRELILADSPINADVNQVLWLTDDYQGGTACRLHFKFPFAVPFTELVIRPFSRYPVQVLQLVWDNRKTSVRNFLSNGLFASGSVGWGSGAATGTTFTFQSSGGYLNHPSVLINAASGRALLNNAVFGFTELQPAMHLRYMINRAETISAQAYVNWYASGAVLLATELLAVDVPSNEWAEFSRLYTAPATAVSGEVLLAFDGSGTVTVSDVVFALTLGQRNTLETIPLQSDSLTVEMANATGTDVWVVLAQPHYDYIQLALPEGDLDQHDLWQEIRLQAESFDESLFQFQPTSWSLQAGQMNDPPRLLTDDGTALTREVKRLGGQVRDLVLSLMKFSKPSPKTVSLNKYLYTLGAWEIILRHHEYAPQGIFVTKPYHPRGEVREVTLQTDPPLSDLDARVRFWLTARSTDKSDKAQLFSGRASFGSSTETPGTTATTHFSIPPVSKREVFNGTDRSGRAAPAFHPYINRETIWNINNTLTSGTIVTPVKFDPNRETYLIQVGNQLRGVTGYRPIQVTLQFPNGTIAYPDVLGKVQPGEISFAGPEVLTAATVTQDLTAFKESDVDAVRTIRVASGRLTSKKQDKKTQTVTLTALQTQFPKIVTGVNGVTFSLYWHNPFFDAASGFVVTRNDVLISPSKYTVDATRGVVVVRDNAPSGNTAYSQFVAYYYYQQDELGVRQSFDSRSASSRPTSGIDFLGALNQGLPITRNVTDYVQGVIPVLRPVDLEELSPTYYPVYEYYVDDRGRLIFADILSSFGDTPAQITVDYSTLAIEPRLIIEYAQGALNNFSTKTPSLHSFTLFMNSKR